MKQTRPDLHCPMSKLARDIDRDAAKVRRSYVRGEMAFGSDKEEAAHRAAHSRRWIETCFRTHFDYIKKVYGGSGVVET